jgi:two-component system response regulator TtrR
MTKKRKPTVFVIDDDPVICESLRWVFASVNLATQIYDNCFDYLKNYDSQREGCLLIDVRLPEMSGLELQQKLITLNNPIPIIMMTGHGDVTLAVHAMKAGARDFILKPFNNDILLDQIQKVIMENVAYHKNDREYVDRIAHLTKREREILVFIVEGSLNKQIAHHLGISNSTVEKHRAQIIQKMKVKSSTELVTKYTSLKSMFKV